jgi:hypothetical protein
LIGRDTPSCTHDTYQIFGEARENSRGEAFCNTHPFKQSITHHEAKVKNFEDISLIIYPSSENRAAGTVIQGIVASLFATPPGLVGILPGLKG